MQLQRTILDTSLLTTVVLIEAVSRGGAMVLGSGHIVLTDEVGHSEDRGAQSPVGEDEEDETECCDSG
jgi:hypothetical protein